MLTLEGEGLDAQQILTSVGCWHHFLITLDQIEMQTDQLGFRTQSKVGVAVAANCDSASQCW